MEEKIVIVEVRYVVQGLVKFIGNSGRKEMSY